MFWLATGFFQPPEGGRQTAPLANPRHATLEQADRPSAPEKLSKAGGDAEHLARLMSAPIQVPDGGAMRQFQLATGELYIRNRGGAPRILSIPASQTAAEFQAAIEKARAESGTEPELVLYPAGFPRNESTRRIVTREVVINAPVRGQADAIAEAQGLVFKKALPFAPGSFVYEVPTSAAALAARSATGTAASPLLASLAAKRSLPNDPFAPLQWHLLSRNQTVRTTDGNLTAAPGIDLNVVPVWNYPSTNTANSTRGRGVVIGIVDDGMEWSHPDLFANAKKDLQYDWNGKDNDPKPDLLNGDDHGTACAGVAAARGNNRIGVSGVAPEAGLAGMRLIAGEKTDLDEAEAMVWKMGQIHILSNSWGPPDRGFILEAPDKLTLSALKYAADFGRNGRGTIITFAGGNGRAPDLDRNGNLALADDGLPIMAGSDNSNYDGYANSIYTIAVGAVSSTGSQSDYSESGANLVVSAPSNTTDGTGLGIMTTDNKGGFGYNPGFSGNGSLSTEPDFRGSGDFSRWFGGTSSATPAVSGVVALMLEKNPALGWRDVQEILMRTATRVDKDDTDWITANRTSHVPGQPLVPFQFNHKYGAGLVNAAAAVNLAASWKNLGTQQTKVVSRNLTQRINAASTVRRTFTVNGTNLRTEHATLELTITDIPKGDLNITLRSPGNTNSTLCVPHTDDINEFTNWKFMTVRNWGENSNGVWELTVTNNGTLTGNLTRAELTVYGTATANATTLVTAAASAQLAPVGSNITLNATATALNANGTVSGSITGVQFFRTTNGTGNATLIGNGTLSGNSPSNPATFSLVWNTANLTAGNYSITAVARSSGNVTGTSAAVPLVLEAPLLAGWDFQTANSSTVPLTTALYGTRTYRANFGNGTLFMNGSNQSSRWDVAAGEVFSGEGTAENAQAGFSRTATNPAALLLRGGRNLSANGKSIVFQIDMSNSRRLDISYAAAATAGGFNLHTWDYYDATARTWRRIEQKTIPVTLAFSTVRVAQVPGIGFNGRPNALVRLTVSGASSITGTNLIDNISFKASR